MINKMPIERPTITLITKGYKIITKGYDFDYTHDTMLKSLNTPS